MSSIAGFGEAEWSVMMGSVSFRLEGTSASVVIRPKDMGEPQPSWWPTRVANELAQGAVVTVEKLKALFPNFAEVEWELKGRSFTNNVEIHAISDDLRITVIGHASSNHADSVEATSAALRVYASELKTIIS